MPPDPQTAPFNLTIDDPVWDDLLDQPAATVQQIWQQLRLVEPRLDAQRVEIILTDNDLVQQLNQAHRGKDAPTNILSFPYPPEQLIGVPVELLAEYPTGELYVASGVMVAEAAAAAKPLAHHFAHLILHGLLHLLGHDHETEAEAAVMEAIEIQLLAQLGIPNPYNG
jgi:probable rRNA maturation factor